MPTGPELNCKDLRFLLGVLRYSDEPEVKKHAFSKLCEFFASAEYWSTERVLCPDRPEAVPLDEFYAWFGRLVAQCRQLKRSACMPGGVRA